MRSYLPTLAELLDRLSITTLKSIKLHENKNEYEKESKLIMDDIHRILKNKKIRDYGQLMRAIGIIFLINEMIWASESKARAGRKQDLNLLKLTHSLNRIRAQAKNVISQEIGERKDLKLDYIDAELTKQFGYDFGDIL